MSTSFRLPLQDLPFISASEWLVDGYKEKLYRQRMVIQSGDGGLVCHIVMLDIVKSGGLTIEKEATLTLMSALKGIDPHIRAHRQVPRKILTDLYRRRRLRLDYSEVLIAELCQ